MLQVIAPPPLKLKLQDLGPKFHLDSSANGESDKF
jgi:hypothetical protein